MESVDSTSVSRAVFEERILTKKKRHSGPAKRARASARREQIEADKKRRADVRARLVGVSDQGTAGTAAAHSQIDPSQIDPVDSIPCTFDEELLLDPTPRTNTIKVFSDIVETSAEVATASEVSPATHHPLEQSGQLLNILRDAPACSPKPLSEIEYYNASKQELSTRWPRGSICQHCRRGKRKCDRIQPTCSRCAKSHRSCVYEPSPPAPQAPRAPRAPRAPQTPQAPRAPCLPRVGSCFITISRHSQYIIKSSRCNRDQKFPGLARIEMIARMKAITAHFRHVQQISEPDTDHYLLWEHHSALTPPPLRSGGPPFSSPSTGSLATILSPGHRFTSITIIVLGIDGFTVDKDGMLKFIQHHSSLPLRFVICHNSASTPHSPPYIDYGRGKSFAEFDLLLLQRVALNSAQDQNYQDLLDAWARKKKGRMNFSVAGVAFEADNDKDRNLGLADHVVDATFAANWIEN